MTPLLAYVRQRPIPALLGVFGVSRVLYYLAGIRFDTLPLVQSWQYIDQELLEQHLLESVWYSHTQPPLFNLFLGTVLKLSPFSEVASFQAIWLGFGLVLTLVLYDLLRRLGASETAAFVTTALIVVSPATVLYQNWLFYSFPLAVLLVVSANLLHRYASTPRARLLVGYVVAVAAIVMIRSMFHPIWYACAALLPLVLVRSPISRRATLAAVGLPLVLMLGWSLRAALLFDSPTMSSWSGMNFGRAITQQLPASERRALVAEGELSEYAVILPFLPYDKYVAVAEPCAPEHPDIPVLAEVRKSTGGPNFNYECYLPVYEAYQADVSSALKANPGAVLRGEITALQMHLQPNSIYNLVKANREEIDGFDELFRRTVLLEVTLPAFAAPTDAQAIAKIQGNSIEYRMSLTVVAGYIATLLLAAKAVIAVRRGDRGPTAITLLFIGGTVVWVLVVGNLFEFQENHRFRFMIDPFLFGLLGLSIDRIVRRFRARHVDADATPGATDGHAPSAANPVSAAKAMAGAGRDAQPDDPSASASSR